MRRQVKRIAGAAIAIVLAAAPILAHHSFAAEYDSNKPVTLKGAITRVEWTNPHVYFYMDVKDERGAVVNWAVENGAPNGLYRNGWRKESLKVGDIVTVEGSLAKDGSHLANAKTVTLPDGRRVFSGSADTPAGEQK
jgi:uncharacterized protein DUF6152